jgi:outer membrane lipoprotein SlyB
MKRSIAIALAVSMIGASGCAQLESIGGSKYGETQGSSVSQAERSGKITKLEVVQVDEDYKFGVGTVVGAVAGGLLGSLVGSGRGTTVAIVAGAAAGAAAGTAAESKMKKKDAQQVTVQMGTGGQVTIVQPVDTRLKSGMNVWVEGSGESARVVPR